MSLHSLRPEPEMSLPVTAVDPQGTEAANSAEAQPARDLVALNAWLETLDAERRVEWALAHGDGNPALSSSFGAQSAVTLHLLTRQKPDIPVILIDTGYLFPETYRFADELADRLKLNLQVYRPLVSRAWMEARHGRLWEQGVVGLDNYNQLRKVEPMRRALDELGVGTWFTGLRRNQSASRADTPIVQQRGGRLKVSPIADWSDRDVWQYLKQHDLPYHPLWHEGYVSIGDFHTTTRWEPGMRDEDTRFFGLKRECGIHEDI
jgi:phosphoadenosine phosphosulfate reductase